MARLPLTGGAYMSQSVIANAQRCVNLYPERNHSDAPVPLTHYQTPGLTRLTDGTGTGCVRQLYRTTKNQLFMVRDSSVYYVSSLWALTLLGTIGTSTGYVSMSDNGLALVIVDGSTTGYTVDLTTTAYTFGTIAPSNFYGATKVDYVDTFFLFSRPNSPQLYISGGNVSYAMLTGGTAFDPLDIASKTGATDNLSGLIVMHREVWVYGTLRASEVWYNSGSADFPFQQVPGAYIEHGCVSTASIAVQDLTTYWLGSDAQGSRVVFQGMNYQALRISTHAIEQEFATYTTVSDAIGYTYQQNGHTFYVLTFPTADKTWVYDESTQVWHQRAWSDSDGNLRRHRGNCFAYAYDTHVVGDHSNGQLYKYDLNRYTDDGNPIVRIRSFPHIMNDGKRMSYSQFIADMEVGNALEITGQSYEVFLRCSDDRGKSYSYATPQSIGEHGEYRTCVQWQRLGMARDRVFELSWSVPAKTALNGAFINATPMRS